LNAADAAAAADDERLKFHYIGRVSRGSQQERLSLDAARSIEGGLHVFLLGLANIYQRML